VVPPSVGPVSGPESASTIDASASLPCATSFPESVGSVESLAASVEESREEVSAEGPSWFPDVASLLDDASWGADGFPEVLEPHDTTVGRPAAAPTMLSAASCLQMLVLMSLPRVIDSIS
jgi:hypothetical protein